MHFSYPSKEKFQLESERRFQILDPTTVDFDPAVVHFPLDIRSVDISGRLFTLKRVRNLWLSSRKSGLRCKVVVVSLDERKIARNWHRMLPPHLDCESVSPHIYPLCELLFFSFRDVIRRLKTGENILAKCFQHFLQPNSRWEKEVDGLMRLDYSSRLPDELHVRQISFERHKVQHHIL